MGELLTTMLGYLLAPSPELVAVSLISGATVTVMALIHVAAKIVRALAHGFSSKGLPAILSTPALVRPDARPVAPLPSRIDPALIWRALDGANATVGAGEKRAGAHTSSANQLIDAASFTYDRLRQDISTIMPVPQRPLIALVKPTPAEREAVVPRGSRPKAIEAA